MVFPTEGSEDEDPDLDPGSDSEWDSDSNVHINPDTDEKFTIKSLSSHPEYHDILKNMPKCSDPGHSCWDSYKFFMKTTYHDNDSVPMEQVPMRVVSRQMWGAAPAKSIHEPSVLPSVKLIFYYNVGFDPCFTEEECKKSVKELQRRQMEEDGLSDIGFNFVVGGDLSIYEGRGWHSQPDESHKFPQWRHRRIDIAFMTPLLKNNVRAEDDVVFVVSDFLRFAARRLRMAPDPDLYEIRDHYKQEVQSPLVYPPSC